jgi:multidrug efflux pump subunit AcrB
MSLPSIAIRRPVAVAMFFLGVVFLGLLSFFRLPIDLLPDVAYPRLVVYTTDPGAAPAEVERFITEPVEQAVSTVPGVQGVESVTREGASLVTARFAPAPWCCAPTRAASQSWRCPSRAGATFPASRSFPSPSSSGGWSRSTA